MIPANTVTQYRNAVKKVLDGLDEARTLGLVIASQGGTATLFVEGSFSGDNADIDVDKLTGAIISIGAIEALVTAGGNAHLTNLNKMRA